ncbi:MAG: DHH family phosphoesterase [Spirochaetia bacterium]|nr:DHH family phosphoesterase [Spirochaetia bacterium]
MKNKAVLCNQAADLDSTVCTILYAQAFNAIPVINIPRNELRLRKEVSFVLNQAGISADCLHFVDEIPLEQMHRDGSLELVLVDHNHLSDSQCHLSDAVTLILDHHRDDGTNAAEKHIEAVGSCATVVVSHILESGMELDRTWAYLAASAILTDTACMSPEAGLAKEKDRIILAHCLKILDMDLAQAEELYRKILSARTDLKGYTTGELLQKDYKEISTSAGKIGFSAIYESLEKTAETHPDFSEEAATFMADKKLAYLLIMTFFNHGTFQKELAILPVSETAVKIISFLNCHSLDMSAKGRIKGMEIYRQGNVVPSRKQILPLVAEFFSTVN